MASPSPTRTTCLLLTSLIGSGILTTAGKAQETRSAWLGLTGGLSILGLGQLARDYNTGPNVSLTASVPAGGRLSIRASVERASLPYDRARFFRQLGIGRVELEGQLGAAASLTTWSVGPEVTLCQPRLELYSFGAVGRDSRKSGTGPLLALYCEPPTLINGADRTIRAPTDWTPPSGCAEAVAGARIDGRGASLGVGAGLRWRDRRGTGITIESGYVRSLLTPQASTFPLRVGVGVFF